MEDKIELTSEPQEEEEEIDLLRLFDNFIHAVQHFWYFGIGLVVLGAMIGFGIHLFTWSPKYQVSASVVIQSATSASQEASDAKTTTQIGTTFQYIVTSSVLRRIVANDLGLEKITATISAEPVGKTNLLVISAIDSSPQTAYDVLCSVLDHYSSVAEYTIGATKLTIVTEPVMPTSVYNQNSILKKTGLGAGCGLFLFCSILVIYCLQRKNILVPNDMKQISNLSYLSAVPFVDEKKRTKSTKGQIRINKKHIPPEFVESIRTLGNRVTFDMEEQNRKIFMITSATKGEGKTTITMNLGILLAHRGKRVIMLDLNLHSPKLAERMGVTTVTCDLDNFLKEKATLTRYRHLSLYLAPQIEADKSGATIATLFRSEKFNRFLAICKDMADVVLIDTPAVEAFADASIIASHADAAILVVRQDSTSTNQMYETIDRLSDTNVHMTGFVMNALHTSFGGGYGSYGSYGYGSGYGYGSNYGYGSGGYGYGSGGYGYGSNNYGSSGYAYGANRYMDASRYQQEEFSEEHLDDDSTTASAE